MELAPGLRVAQRHLRLIAIIAVAAAALAYAVSYVVPPGYSATATVLVRARDARFLTAASQDLSKDPGSANTAIGKSLTQTNAGLLKSRDVAVAVVTDLHLDVPPPPDTSILGTIRGALKQVGRVVLALIRYGYYAEPSPFEAAVTDTQNNLEANPVKDSYLIEVKATADSPEKAAAIANRAAVGLVQVTRDRAQADAQVYRDFLGGQVDRALAAVTTANQAIQAYKEQQGITDVTGIVRAGTTAGTIQQQLAETEVALGEAIGRQRSLAATLATLSETESTTSTLTTGRSSTTTTNVGPNKVYQEIASLKLQADADVDALTAKRTALQSGAQSGLTTTLLPAQESKLSELELQSTSAEDTFKSISTQYQAAVVTSAEGALEVSQADVAGVPTYPVKPVRYLFALFGILCGLVGGFMLAKYTDGRGGSAEVPVTEPGRPARIPHPVMAPQVGATTTAVRTEPPKFN